ncbi:MAG: sugar ABC transporter substrate-binding protein [Ruminococcus sp.]|nr:sugar ABC transporter substrate-binding protein [Ruminococcus sp.]
MKKKVLAVLLTATMAISMAACGNSSEGGDKDIKIAYIVKAKTDEFWTAMEKGAYAYAEANGVELSFQAPEKETDVEKQVQMVENAVIKGFDAIILSAADSKSLVPAIVKANNADIPVILVNDVINEEALSAEGGHVETYVGIDQYEAASLAGTYAQENTEGGKVAYLEGISGVAAHEERLNGFKDQVDFEVVSSQTAKCDRNEAFNVMQNVLSANPEVNVVWAINAEMGQGAIQAIEQGGFSGKVQVFDFDASSDDIEAIKAGTLIGSVAQFPNLQAEAAIQACLDVLDGKELEEHTKTKAELITADNVEDFEAENK